MGRAVKADSIFLQTFYVAHSELICERHVKE